MNWLTRFFSIGRLTGEPSGHTAGRALAPASVQRHHLGLAAVDLPAGVVRLRSGEVRAVLAVSGVPLHQMGQDAAHAVLTRWAAAINAMPPATAWLVRSRPGVLASYALAKRERAADLRREQPGTALAKLAADQATHLARLAARGDLRVTENFVGVRHAKGDARALLKDAEAARAQILGAGLKCRLLTEWPLFEALAWSWQPYVSESWAYTAADSPWRLVVGPGAARVERVPPQQVPPGATTTTGRRPALANGRTNWALTGARKALGR